MAAASYPSSVQWAARLASWVWEGPPVQALPAPPPQDLSRPLDCFPQVGFPASKPELISLLEQEEMPRSSPSQKWGRVLPTGECEQGGHSPTAIGQATTWRGPGSSEGSEDRELGARSLQEPQRPPHRGPGQTAGPTWAMCHTETHECQSSHGTEVLGTAVVAAAHTQRRTGTEVPEMEALLCVEDDRTAITPGMPRGRQPQEAAPHGLVMSQQ